MKKCCGVLFCLLLVGVSYAQGLKEAVQFSNREQFQKAKNILIGMVKSDAKGTDHFYYLGDVYWKNNQSDSAKYWFMEGLKKDENSALSYVGLGKVAMEQNPTEGNASFNKAVSLTKKDGRVYASIAEYYISLDKPNGAKALEYAQKGVEIDPKNAWVKLVEGEAYYAGQDGSKAMEQYKASMRLDPSSPLPLWKMGRLYLNTKAYDVGLQTLKDGLVLDSLFAPIYREMGELYLRATKYDKAIECYKKYLSIRDASDETDLRYASFLFMNKNYDNSLTLLNNLNKKNYNSPLVYRLLGYAQFETKDYANAQKSMDVYFQKVDIRKVIADDYLYYGKILGKNGKDSLAVVYLKKTLERDSTLKEVYGEIVNVWYNAKKYDKAAEAYKTKIKALNYTPKSTALANDYLAMGRCYMLVKDYVKADSAFAMVVEAKPELQIGYWFRAKANSYMDISQEKGLAKPFYEKFIELAKSDKEKNKNDLIEAYSYLGSYYLIVAKDKVKANEAWDGVRELDPTNKKAADAAKFK